MRKSFGGDPCQCPKAIAALGPVLLCEECNQPTYMGNGNPRTEIYGGGPAWEHCNCAGAKARVEAKNAAQAKQWAEFEAKKKEESDKEDAARRADWAKMTRQFAKEQAIVNDDAGLEVWPETSIPPRNPAEKPCCDEMRRRLTSGLGQV